MRIAVIPARGGSKRISRKNIRDFCGKPIIAYAIDTALKSRLFEKVIVSTDDPAIADISLRCGAEVPFVRSQDLANDFTATVPVIADAIQRIEKELGPVGDVCCIYPCTPLLTVIDLYNGLEMLNKLYADYCFPITASQVQIHKALRLHLNGKVQPFFPESETQRTQDIAVTYQDAGQFYWGRRDAWLHNPKIHSSGVALVLPKGRVIDIDNLDDWFYAEYLYKKNINQKVN